MGVFHLLHHEHQARYDKMFPYLWAYTGLLALAGLLFGLAGHEDILRGLYIIVTTEDALITDYVLVAGGGAGEFRRCHRHQHLCALRRRGHP